MAFMELRLTTSITAARETLLPLNSAIFEEQLFPSDSNSFLIKKNTWRLFQIKKKKKQILTKSLLPRNFPHPHFTKEYKKVTNWAEKRER